MNRSMGEGWDRAAFDARWDLQSKSKTPLCHAAGDRNSRPADGASARSGAIRHWALEQSEDRFDAIGVAHVAEHPFRDLTHHLAGLEID